MNYGRIGNNGAPDKRLVVLYSCAADRGSSCAKWCNPARDNREHQDKVSNDRAQRIKWYQQTQ